MQLYHITDQEFSEWLEAPTTYVEDMVEAVAVLRAKRSLLWMPGSQDSYLRDRYERDATYVQRINDVLDALEVRGHDLRAHLLGVR